jgi:hypothetical protein
MVLSQGTNISACQDDLNLTTAESPLNMQQTKDKLLTVITLDTLL